MKTNLDDDHSHVVVVVKERLPPKTVPTHVIETGGASNNTNSNSNSSNTESGLQDSEVTSPTEAGSYSEEEGNSTMGSWLLGGIMTAADLRSLAVSLKETAGGVVGFVQQSALSFAAEISELERGETALQEATGANTLASEGKSTGDKATLKLPWEIRNDEGEFVEDEELKDRILKLSSDQNTFLQPLPRPDESIEKQEFPLDNHRIDVIRKLLVIDKNLARTHAQLTGRNRVREATFWQNYFHNCEITRKDYLQQIWVRPIATVDSSTSLRSSNSLVPDDERTHQTEEDSSYVCVTSAPTSMNSLFGLQTLDEDMVVINTLTTTGPREHHY